LNYFSDISASRREATNGQQPLSEQVFDLGELIRLIGRRKMLIAGFVASCAIIAVVALQLMTPIFTAETEVILDNREQNIADIKAVLTEDLGDDIAIVSEIEVMQSRGLASKVVEQLQLLYDPEFNGALQPPSPITQIKEGFVGAVRGFLPDKIAYALGLVEPEPLSPEEEARIQQEETVNAFLDSLSVFAKGESRVIVLTFESESPGKAARIVNAVAETYILDQLDQRYEATRRANQWLAGKLEELRTQVAEAEGAVEAYRQKAGLLGGDQGLLVSQQVSDLNAQLIIARTERAGTEARLNQVRNLVRTAGGAEAAREVLASPIVQALSAQETEVKRKVAELEQEFGQRHPRLINAKAELRDVRAKLAGEVNKVVQTLENEVGVARAREASLMRGLSQLEANVAQANSASVQLRALEREADANRSLLELFLARAEQINAQTDFAILQPNARVISKASVPMVPSAPQKALLLIVTVVVATIIAVVFVMLLEMLNRGFRSGDQIEEATGIRSLGLVPQMKSGRSKARQPETTLVKHPSSLFGEAIRSIYTSILITQNEKQPRTFLVTSCFPKEGKTTLSVCLARLCAMSGKRTVIVEADLRKPQVHKRMDVPQGPGLVEYFLGETDLSQVLYRDDSTGAYVIPSGRAAIDASQILDSPEMGRLLSGLSSQFDLVLLDTPPVMAVSDARVLAPKVDGVVFVVRWSKTDREVVRLGIKNLTESGGRMLGAVLSMVDVQQHAQYGFGDSGYYHKGIKTYYTG